MKKILLLGMFISIMNIVVIAQPGITNGTKCTTCYHTTVTGENASTLGQYTSSTGLASFASGSYSIASGDFSTAFGDNSKATKRSAFAAGSFAEANGLYSISLGRYTFANTQSSVAIGKYVLASGATSFAYGMFLSSSASFAFTLGTGFADDKRLENNVSKSLMIGFNSKLPTFFVGESSASNRTGRIGIGNMTDPQAKLHILGDNDPNNTDDASLFIQSSGNYYSTIWLGDTEHSIKAKPNYDLTFKTPANTDFVFEGGDVGIGVTSPTRTLDVDGTSRIRDDARFDGNVGIGTTNPSERLEVNGNILQSPGFNLTTSQIKAPDANGLSLTDMNGNGVFVGLSGYVGIGIPDPYYNLDVAGNINFTGSIRKNGEIYNPSYWDKNGSVIDYSGKVGIGTTDVDAKLKIFTDNSTGLIVNTHHTSGWGYGIISDVTHDDTKALVVEKRIDESTSDRFTVYGNGRTIIGNNDYPYSGYLLTVAGKVKAREVWVTATAGADFVFVEGYDLPKLGDIEDFITENKHLPDIPSAKQMIEDGLNMGDMQIKMLQKIEELTLYVIEQQKQIERQNNEIKELKNKMK